MPRYRLKLKFLTPFYTGTRNKELTSPDKIIHSDTIFSAIINMYSLVYGLKDTEKFLQKVIKENVFQCSSAFPLVDNIYFVPKPIGYKLGFDEPKKEKKIQFIDVSLLYSGRNVDKGWIEKITQCLADAIKVDEKPRVSVDRITSSSNIYYMAAIDIYYKAAKEVGKNVNYWLFIDVSEEYDERIKTAIKVLGDEGIGGERTYGYGQFVPEFVVDNQEYSGNKYLLLSVCKPEESEVKNISTSGYKIIRRGGYAYTPYQEISTEIRHDIYNLFAEGSVFEEKINGEVVEAGYNPIHKLYKDYRAYLLPFNM